MQSTMHRVDFPYSQKELEALFAYAWEHDVEKGGRYDARSAAVNLWSHHWLNPATREESEIIGTFYVHWRPLPLLYAIETEADFALEDLMQELGFLELMALGYVKHGYPSGHIAS
jgi:hypothetical protein